MQAKSPISVQVRVSGAVHLRTQPLCVAATSGIEVVTLMPFGLLPKIAKLWALRSPVSSPRSASSQDVELLQNGLSRSVSYHMAPTPAAAGPSVFLATVLPIPSTRAWSTVISFLACPRLVRRSDLSAGVGVGVPSTGLVASIALAIVCSCQLIRGPRNAHGRGWRGDPNRRAGGSKSRCHTAQPPPSDQNPASLHAIGGGGGVPPLHFSRAHTNVMSSPLAARRC